MDAKTQTLLRQLPSVQEILLRPDIADLLLEGIGEATVKEAARRAVDARRQALLGGQTEDPSVPSSEVAAVAHKLAAPSLIPVLNATGVVVHTNLGRSPLPWEVMDRLGKIACGYSNLEYDLDLGGRGHRHGHAAQLLSRVTGAEAALVVNNCASAVLLALTGLARDREVIVSRGEEVEIGGAFRVPDVMRQSGARLVEVGTTNRTRLQDYREAITSQTALLLKVHRSNFALVGFTEEASLTELCALGETHGIPTMMDLGSGLLSRPPGQGFLEEPTVEEILGSGVHLVTFSGDKLLGGPQAGILAGKAGIIASLSKHPLLRALRPDKLALGALEGVLALHASGRAASNIPTVRMLNETLDDVASRRKALTELLSGSTLTPLELVPVELQSRPGGGSSPLTLVPSAGLALRHPRASAERLAAALRQGRPPVIGRIEDDTLLLDLRTVLPEEVPPLAEALRRLATLSVP